MDEVHLLDYADPMIGLILFLFILPTRLCAFDVRVFAASSLAETLNLVSKEYAKRSNSKIILNFDASSRLARQIREGAKAHIFFSADREWAKFIQAQSSVDLLRNSLVVIAPASSKQGPLDSKKILKMPFNRLSLAHESVPAGKYAFESLNALGLTENLRPRMVFSENVRGALSWVARDEVDLGVVFATDAKSEPKVKVVASIDPKTHSHIIYPLSLVIKTPESEEFFAFLQSNEAKKIYLSQGFRLVDEK